MEEIPFISLIVAKAFRGEMMMVKTERNKHVTINMKISIVFFIVCFIFAIINLFTPMTELMIDLNPIDNRNTYPIMRNIISGGAIATGYIAIYISLSTFRKKPKQLDLFYDAE
jgi:amino acid transporter